MSTSMVASHWAHDIYQLRHANPNNRDSVLAKFHDYRSNGTQFETKVVDSAILFNFTLNIFRILWSGKYFFMDSLNAKRKGDYADVSAPKKHWEWKLSSWTPSTSVLGGLASMSSSFCFKDVSTPLHESSDSPVVNFVAVPASLCDSTVPWKNLVHSGMLWSSMTRLYTTR